MRRLTPERLQVRLTEAIGAEVEKHSGKRPATLADWLKSTATAEALRMGKDAAEDDLMSAVREARGQLAEKPLVVLVDGLEKAVYPDARDLGASLGCLVREGVGVVVVSPFAVAYSPGPSGFISDREALFVVHPIDVDGEHAEDGRAFLMALLSRRIQRALASGAAQLSSSGRLLDPETWNPIQEGVGRRAAILSGGVPRVFLQLMADAGIISHLREDSPVPSKAALDTAVREQQDSIRRLLQPGDAEALVRAHQTVGLELDPSRKLRLLTQGILLERTTPEGLRFFVHPLSLPVVEERSTLA